MKLNVVVGYREYFFPKVIDRRVLRAGCQQLMAGAQIPTVSWMSDESGIGYHDSIYADQDSERAVSLFLEYVLDSYQSDTPAFVFLPFESLTDDDGRGPFAVRDPRVARFLLACEKQLGDGALSCVRMSLSSSASSLIRALHARRRSQAELREYQQQPEMPIATRDFTGRDVRDELRDALARNYTYNVVKICAELSIEANDTIFEVGDRATALAEHCDQMAMRLRTDVTAEKVLADVQAGLKFPSLGPMLPSSQRAE